MIDEVQEEVVSPRRRVPFQLQRLPAEQLRKLVDGLSDLEGAGLRDVPDILALKAALVDKAELGNEHLPSERFTSENMDMSLWAWTPKRWREAFQKAGLPMQAVAPTDDGEDKSEELKRMVAQRLEKAKPILKKRGLTVNAKNGLDIEPEKEEDEEQYKKLLQMARFWNGMWKAQEEIDALAKSPPKLIKGDGAGALFSFKKDAGKWELPKRKSQNTRAYSAHLQLPAAQKTSFVMVHCGDDGCALGAATWSRLLAQHGLSEGAGDAPLARNEAACGNLAVHFDELKSGDFMPRAIFANQEVAGVGKFGCGPANILQGTNYYPGQECFGFESTDCLMELVRKQAERSGYLEGFLITNGWLEGCGDSAAGTKLAQHLKTEFKRAVWTLSSTPAQGSFAANERDGVLNALRHMSSAVDHTDLSVLIDRESMLSICRAKVDGLGLSDPSDTDMWNLAGGIIPSWTGGLCFGACVPASRGYAGYHPRKIMTNFVPYPRIHFAAVSCAPTISEAMSKFNTHDNRTIVSTALRKGSLSCSSQGKHCSSILLYKGMEHAEASAKVNERRHMREFQSVDWNPSQFFCAGYGANDGWNGVASQPEAYCLHSTCGFGQQIQSWVDCAEAMERLSMDDQEALLNMKDLVTDYSEVGIETADEEVDEEDVY